ncbi:MAG: inositol monophosphatase [Clostridiales bacterium]|jgi:myo-inositol-1(or 4)-monophosphatase|nr:inositol monophosphatase [Clostridiales bacterium]
MLKEIICYTETLVIRAGNLLKEAVKGEVACSYKAGDQRDLLTMCDVEIENYLISNLKSKFPFHAFISEEKENVPNISGYVWIIDPIDGTTNFITFKKDFSISIALYNDAKPLFGIVYDVMNNDLYVGITGQGAYLNDQKLDRLSPVHLQDCILDSSLNSIQFFYNHKNHKVFNIAQVIRGHRCLGAASLTICKIATGKIHMYVSAKIKAWDFAAAGILLSEVGGHYGALYQDELDLSGKPMAFLACSSKVLFDQVADQYFKYK